DYITAHFNLGTLLHDTGDNARAAYHYRRVVESKPNDVEAWNSLGLMLMEPETLVEAIECFRRAIALAPDYAQAHNNLGCALMDQGEIENARPCFVKAIDLDPRFARAYENLVRSRRFTVDDQDIIQRLHAGVEMPGTADESLVIFHFALGKIYDDCADYDTAFHHYRLGNELVKKSTPFDWQGSERTIANTIATFSADFLASRNGFGHESDRPIFIVGMPRSGSTLVEQIISAHPHVRGAGELTYLADMTATIPGLLNTDTPYPECAELLDRAQVHALAEQYLVHFESPSADIRRVTDKLPGNFLHLGLIALMFPDSRIVHCRRDPMDVGLSIYFQRFATRHDYAYDLVDIGTYYRQYQLLMEHWRNMPLPRMMEVDYEQLVAELESCSRRLIDFCGLAWDDRCLNYHQSQRTVRTASNWQVRQPLYSRSVRRWRHYESHLTALSETLAGTRSPL
ncbi:MAG: tetratricopeptide repeat-containing sulfotransferase family protein, partial [Gammaproteobacteria bacterium]